MNVVGSEEVVYKNSENLVSSLNVIVAMSFGRSGGGRCWCKAIAPPANIKTVMFFLNFHDSFIMRTQVSLKKLKSQIVPCIQKFLALPLFYGKTHN